MGRCDACHEKNVPLYECNVCFYLFCLSCFEVHVTFAHKREKSAS